MSKQSKCGDEAFRDRLASIDALLRRGQLEAAAAEIDPLAEQVDRCDEPTRRHRDAELKVRRRRLRAAIAGRRRAGSPRVQAFLAKTSAAVKANAEAKAGEPAKSKADTAAKAKTGRAAKAKAQAKAEAKAAAKANREAKATRLRASRCVDCGERGSVVVLTDKSGKPRCHSCARRWSTVACSRCGRAFKRHPGAPRIRLCPMCRQPSSRSIRTSSAGLPTLGKRR